MLFSDVSVGASLVASTLLLSLASTSSAQCAVGSSDPCCILRTGNAHLSSTLSYPVAVAELSKVRACLRGLARLPGALKSQIVDSLDLKLSSLYAFVDIARNSSDSTACPSVKYSVHELAYDYRPSLQAALQVAATVDFYQALSAVFRGFNDAHTRLFSPLQAFHFLRPMTLSVRASGSGQEVFFARINPLYTLLNVTSHLTVSVKWSEFINRSVRKINGIDALTYLMNQANDFGFHKSRGVRVNQLLKQTYFSLGEHPLPTLDVERYSFADTSEVVAELVAVVTDPRLTNSGTAQVSSFMASRDNTVVSAIKLSNILDEALAYNDIVTLRPHMNNWDLRPLPGSFSNIAIVFEVENAIVLKLPGEFGVSPTNAFLEQGLMDTFIALTTLARNRTINTILIDVIGANGGLVSFSNWLIGALVKEYQTSIVELCETYDFRASQLWDSWVQMFARGYWINAIDHDLAYEQVEEIFEVVVTRKTEFAALFDPDLSSLYVSLVQPKLVTPLQNAMALTNKDQQLASVRMTLVNFFSGAPYSMDRHTIEWYPLVQRSHPTASRPSYTNLSYYNDPRYYRRGGVNGRYTQKFFQGCYTALRDTHPRWAEVQTYFKNIVFLTDGTCGGACALLLSKLQVDGKAKVASFGGVRGEAMDTSFTGGFIEDWPEESEKLRLSGLLGNLVFRSNVTFPELGKPPVPATYTLTAFELYLRQLGTCALPREWYNIPGDEHIDEWATRLDDWPSPDYQQLRRLYVQAIRTLAPTVPPPTTAPVTGDVNDGLSGGALTGVLIATVAVAVVLGLVVYVYVRKWQRKPLMFGSGDQMSSVPILDDSMSLSNPNDDIWPEDTSNQ